ncbi:MAG: PQQ-binding-like beta-propeller repeat protein [Dehalococcoidia bacterium]
MSTDSAPNASTVCPYCGHAVASTAKICGTCLRSIEGGQADRGGLAAREVAYRAGQRRRRIRLASIAAGSVALVAAFIWVQWFMPVTPLPLPSTPARTLVPPTEDASRWPSVAGNAQLQRTTSARPDLAAPERWRVTTSERITTPPVVDEQRVYLGIAGALLAFAREDGREVWRIPIGGQLDAAPTVVGDRVYVTLREGSVLALNAADGKQLWKGGDGPTYFSSVVVDRGVVFGSALGRLTGLDAETGTVLWRQDTDNRVSAQAQPAVTPAHVLQLSYRRALLFDRATGEQLFYYSMPSPEHVAVEGSRGFIVGSDRIVAFGFDQRRPWWEFWRTAWGQLWIFGMAPAPPPQPRHWVQPTERGTLAPTIADGALITASTTGGVRALDLASGEVRWEAKVGPVASAPVTTAAGVLLVQRDALLLLDPATGTEVAKRPMRDAGLRSAAVTSAGTYLVAGDSGLIALR